MHREQHDHECSERVAVIDENVRRVRPEISQQEPDRGVAGDERHDDRDDDRAPAERREVIPLVYELDSALRPLRHYYLGDQDEVARRISAVSAQGKAKA